MSEKIDELIEKVKERLMFEKDKEMLMLKIKDEIKSYFKDKIIIDRKIIDDRIKYLRTAPIFGSMPSGKTWKWFNDCLIAENESYLHNGKSKAERQDEKNKKLENLIKEETDAEKKTEKR